MPEDLNGCSAWLAVQGMQLAHQLVCPLNICGAFAACHRANVGHKGGCVRMQLAHAARPEQLLHGPNSWAMAPRSMQLQLSCQAPKACPKRVAPELNQYLLDMDVRVLALTAAFLQAASAMMRTARGMCTEPSRLRKGVYQLAHNRAHRG